MNIINKIPLGEEHPLINDGHQLLYIRFVYAAVYDQDDDLNELDLGIFGNPGMPRFTETFQSVGEAVYKPNTRDKIRYKVRIKARWRKRVGDTFEEGDATAFVGHLRDGGQWIQIERGPTNPSIKVTSGIDGQDLSLFAGAGTVYLVDGDGNLVRYVHDAYGNFASYSGQVIGSGWGGMSTIRAVRDGHLYCVSPKNDLLYYHHDGAGAWTTAGRAIGWGWGFPWVGAGRFGQLYAINQDGHLLYYQHDNDFDWKIASAKIGEGWPTRGVFTGGANCLYLIDGKSDLRYYYHDDARNWVRSGATIGTGWGGFKSVSSSGNGEIYGVAANDDLLFYRHDVDRRFLSGSGRTIGWGWGAVGRHGVIASSR